MGFFTKTKTKTKTYSDPQVRALEEALRKVASSLEDLKSRVGDEDCTIHSTK